MVHCILLVFCSWNTAVKKFAIFSGGIGAGEVYPGIFYKMDAIGFGESDSDLTVMHKVGRPPNPNWNLLPALGDFAGNPGNPFSRLGCKQK